MTVRQIGSIEGQRLAAPNQWEEVKRSGATSIQRWIDHGMVGKSCVVVLIGAKTAERPWVQYEIRKGWAEGKGVLGVHIHGLKDRYGYTSAMGANPFTGIQLPNGRWMSDYAPVYNPPGFDSKQVYASIQNNIETWIEAAIAVRKRA